MLCSSFPPYRLDTSRNAALPKVSQGNRFYVNFNIIINTLTIFETWKIFHRTSTIRSVWILLEFDMHIDPKMWHIFHFTWLICIFFSFDCHTCFTQISAQRMTPHICIVLFLQLNQVVIETFTHAFIVRIWHLSLSFGKFNNHLNWDWWIATNWWATMHTTVN